MALVQDNDKTLMFLKSETALCAVPLPKPMEEDHIDRALNSSNNDQSRQPSGGTGSFNDHTQLNDTSVTSMPLVQNEFLLCFKNSAVYVDAYTGTRTRQNEIQYPTEANYVCYNDKMSLVMVFTYRGIDILNPRTSEWLQSIPLKNPTPLNNYGRLIYSGHNDTNMKLFYLKQNEKSLKIESSWYKSSSSEIGGGDAGSANINPSHSISVINQPPGREVPKPAKQLLLNRIQMGVDEPELRICNKISLGKTKKQLTNLGRKKWRYAVPYNVKKELLYSKLKDPANRSKLISDPTDFSHVGHIGQQDGNRFDSSKMIDLKEQQRQNAVAQAQAKSISLERGVINFGGMTKQHITVSDGHLLPHSSEGRRRDTYQQQGHLGRWI